MRQVASIVGKVIGKPDLQYVQFSYEDAEKGMLESGISPSVAQSFVEMNRAMNDGKLVPYQEGAAEITSTSFQEFASTVFVNAFR